jgi:hypothetical protein
MQVFWWMQKILDMHISELVLYISWQVCKLHFHLTLRFGINYMLMCEASET